MQNSIKSHCVNCKITFKKIAGVGTKCKNCNSLLTYQCKMCKEHSKSLCGIYDHLDNNCELAICKKCNNRFETRADAIKHKVVCNDRILMCKFCKYKTKDRGLLNKHTAKHNNENVTTYKYKQLFQRQV